MILNDRVFPGLFSFSCRCVRFPAVSCIRRNAHGGGGAVAGAQHAEQILLEWATANHYLVLAIAAGGRDICEEYCVTALEDASAAQNAEYGVPIFFVPGGYY